MTLDRPFRFTCPSCQAPLEPAGPDRLHCPAEGQVYPCQDGIWRLLPPGREAAYRRFVTEYEAVRRGEGRGSSRPEYYRALPDPLPGGRPDPAWRIRAAGYQTLLERVFRPRETTGRPLRILDLGAGCGWLANRLAGRGHTLLAVDLLTNDFDGLGCWRFYETTFTPLQAEFDCLPLPASSADLVIFNASLHYSTDYTKTVSQAARLLAPGGLIAILDSPCYHDPASGQRMVQERQADFIARFGFPSDALPSLNFLTYAGLADLARRLDLHLTRQTPAYGLAWNLRPILARLLGRREPAKFHLFLLHPQDSSYPFRSSGVN